MTVTVTSPPPTTACPRWCTLPADHARKDDQTEFTREHRGPVFRFVWLGDHESSSQPGRVAPTPDVMVGGGDHDRLTPDDLRQLAREAMAAGVGGLDVLGSWSSNSRETCTPGHESQQHILRGDTGVS